jgi:uncharacterized protein (TIGR03083 family)
MTSVASEAEVREMVAGELADLADTVAGFTDDQWDAPTLCAGWRVREVIAHMTMPTRLSSVRFFAELARDRGNVNRMADRFARRDAALPTNELVDAMRSDHLRRWTPPGGGGRGALVHAVIHGLDITEALALDRTVPPDRLRVVLSEVVQPKSTRFFGLDVDGLRIEVTDLEWASGEGSVVRADGRTVVLLLCGRPLAPGALSGEGAARLTACRP